ncbi:MAG TPA: zinc ribbon domain-containing protein [Planctomycetota bacterium]|nr:zinc ribbon domain-containing protein [Planctomycetota bacterium]
MLLVLLLALAQEEPVVIRTAEAPAAESFPARELPAGEVGVVLGAAPELRELMAAAGFSASPGARGKLTFVTEPKASGSGTVVWVSSLPREQTAAALREAKGIALCIVTGRGGGDPEPLKIGEAWMVQAPGSSGLWGRIELRGGTVTNRYAAPGGKPSEKVAASKKKLGLPADDVDALREGAKPGGAADPVKSRETGNRACRFRILASSERAAYGAKIPAPGRKLLVLDAEFENIIPLTLIQQNQVPTMYRIKDLADHLYLVVNGNRVSRLPKDAATLPGHVQTVGFTLERLGTRARGNLVFEIPSDGVDSLDLRFYDYAHGHFTMALQPASKPDPAKMIGAAQQNEILEAGLFRAERATEVDGKKAPDGMTWLLVDFRARSQMFTEGDATAFDPKAAPGQKLKIGTVSDWTDLRRHFNVLVDGSRSFGSVGEPEIGESPRFLPDVLTGGLAVFQVPEKAASLELRCDFPNAKLPDGALVHPKPLLFLLEGKRPEAASAGPAIASIDDDIYKVAITGQAVVPDFAGMKAPAGTTFLVLDVTVTGAGKAGEMFQTADQLFYATEKGQQLPMHEAAYKGPAPVVKLLLVPTGERRSFQAVYAIPQADKRLRLAYRGVTKALVVDLKPLEEAAPVTPARRLCPKCKAPADPAEKFCAECGTKIDPK